MMNKNNNLKILLLEVWREKTRRRGGYRLLYTNIFLFNSPPSIYTVTHFTPVMGPGSAVLGKPRRSHGDQKNLRHGGALFSHGQIVVCFALETNGGRFGFANRVYPRSPTVVGFSFPDVDQAPSCDSWDFSTSQTIPPVWIHCSHRAHGFQLQKPTHQRSPWGDPDISHLLCVLVSNKRTNTRPFPSPGD